MNISGQPVPTLPGSGKDTGDDTTTAPVSGVHPSFAEEALRLSGKSAEEVRRLGAVDAADEQVETLFAARYQTAASPIHRAVWDAEVRADQWDLRPPPLPSEAERVMRESLEIVQRHRQAQTLYDSQGKIAEAVLRDLADAGYWGLLVDQRYGGVGLPFAHFAPFLTRMATIEPTVAGLASVHGCIGAVDPVQTFGTEEQKQRWLPQLASGRRLSAFALTEPNAGSDLTALRTIAVRDGDDYVVTGEKLFITNVYPGRTIGLVCLIDNRPAVLIVDLPEQETPQFRLKRYGLYALRHAHNYGIVFDGLRVPVANRLHAPGGDGLMIAYHGLNRGRVSLCATAAGTLRLMLADMLPWARFRVTYGQPIIRRELVRRRVGHLAGLIVACDALAAWTAALLDAGYRGEMECIVAKIFGSEAQKEAAIELHMKTHGGRAFLHGHLFGDNVHDFLAPCIYEGEGEMLGMAFFKALVKQHGRRYFEPIGRILAATGIRRPNFFNPLHLWILKEPLWAYSRWWVAQRFRSQRYSLPALPRELEEHARFAAHHLARIASEISGVMRKHQLKLADRQCRMSELSARTQSLAVILCTAVYAAHQEHPLIRAAADILCRTLTRQFLGQRPTDRDFRDLTELGAAIADQPDALAPDVVAPPILMPYPP
jgi:alkylation response protein AidB-like acyl-CoA dehydrogenase